MKTDRRQRHSAINQAIRSALLGTLFLLAAGLPAHAASAAEEQKINPCSVLAVMSYHDGYPWQDEIHAGIMLGMGNKCAVTFFNLDSLRRPDSVAQRAVEAFALFQKMRPAGVIASDDAAQKYFIVPYLKDRTAVPVVFCGVNAKPAAYGYPASNVTGILERYHGRETMQFLRQLYPQAKTFIFLTSTSITANSIAREIREGERDYPLRAVGVYQAATIEEAVAAVRAMHASADALYLEQFEGIQDRSGRTLTHREELGTLLREWKDKPSLCANEYSVRFGCLLAVQKSGTEQGSSAVRTLLSAISGMPVGQIPITKNFNGVKILNVQTMKELRINPPLNVFREAKLVRTED